MASSEYGIVGLLPEDRPATVVKVASCIQREVARHNGIYPTSMCISREVAAEMLPSMNDMIFWGGPATMQSFEDGKIKIWGVLIRLYPDIPPRDSDAQAKLSAITQAYIKERDIAAYATDKIGEATMSAPDVERVTSLVNEISRLNAHINNLDARISVLKQTVDQQHNAETTRVSREGALLMEIADLKSRLAAFTAANVPSADPKPLAHNPFRVDERDRRRMGP